MSGRQRVTEEGGFSLIEVVVAALCLAVLMGAAATLFGVGDTSSLAAQRNAAEISIADRYIEKVRTALKTTPGAFGSLAMNALPSAATNTTLPGQSSAHTDPNDFVSAGTGCGTSNEGYMIETNWDNSSEGTAAGLSSWTGCATGVEPLVYSASGLVAYKQTVTSGTDTYTVYAYVTDTNLGCSTTLGSCSTVGTPVGDAKRVIVAVVQSNGGTQNVSSGSTTANYRIGQNTPVYVSTIFTNPVPTNQSNSTIGLTLGVSLG
jgi:type II secretory pathway pseudopilin PulG